MTGKELLKMSKTKNKVSVKFTEYAQDLEFCIFQKDMMADIISVSKEEDYLIVKVDRTKYNKDNKKLEISHYCNYKTGEYNLNYEDYCKLNNINIGMIQEFSIDINEEIPYFNVI